MAVIDNYKLVGLNTLKIEIKVAAKIHVRAFSITVTEINKPIQMPFSIIREVRLELQLS